MYRSNNRPRIVYTDGACVRNGMKDARAGIGVFWGNNHRDNVSERHTLERQTNNSAEICAVIRALEQYIHRGYSQKLIVKTDSQFLINAVYKWVPKWERNGWLTCNGHKVANRKELRKLIRLMNDIDDVDIVKVDGHSNIYGNVQADKFAREGCWEDIDYFDDTDSDDQSDY